MLASHNHRTRNTRSLLVWLLYLIYQLQNLKLQPPKRLIKAASNFFVVVFPPRFGHINSNSPVVSRQTPQPPLASSSLLSKHISASQSHLWQSVSVCYSSAPFFFFPLLCTSCSPAPCQGLWGCGPSWRHTKTDWRASKGAHCSSVRYKLKQQLFYKAKWQNSKAESYRHCSGITTEDFSIFFFGERLFLLWRKKKVEGQS